MDVCAGMCFSDALLVHPRHRDHLGCSCRSPWAGGGIQGCGTHLNQAGGFLVNAEQRKMLEVAFVIVGCFGIYAFTSTLQVIHYCDWTGLRIHERLGHEVTLVFVNGTLRYYCCVNISLLAFQHLIDTGQSDRLEGIQVRCAVCGMLMDWNSPMVIWIHQSEYLCPTTGTPTIVAVCKDSASEELCESHFLEQHGGDIMSNPYGGPL